MMILPEFVAGGKGHSSLFPRQFAISAGAHRQNKFAQNPLLLYNISTLDHRVLFGMDKGIVGR